MEFKTKMFKKWERNVRSHYHNEVLEESKNFSTRGLRQILTIDQKNIQGSRENDYNHVNIDELTK